MFIFLLIRFDSVWLDLDTCIQLCRHCSNLASSSEYISSVHNSNDIYSWLYDFSVWFIVSVCRINFDDSFYCCCLLACSLLRFQFNVCVPKINQLALSLSLCLLRCHLKLKYIDIFYGKNKYDFGVCLRGVAVSHSMKFRHSSLLFNTFPAVLTE